MPRFKEDDTVYALKNIDEPPNDYSPGGRLCEWGTKLIVRKVVPINENFNHYHVSHPEVTDGRTFMVVAKEISHMKHFEHNRR